MSPVPQRDAWTGSDETSGETELAVSPVPEVFLSHLPQHFQDPDSPNLHMLQHHDRSRSTQKPTVRSQTTRSTLRAFRLPTGTPVNDQKAGVLRPIKVTTLEDVMQDNGRNTDTTHLSPQQTGATPKESTNPSTTSLPPRAGPRIPDTLRPPPPMHPVGNTRDNVDRSSFHPVRSEGQDVRVSTRSHGEWRGIETTKPPTSTTTVTSKRLDPGFLKLPGHEPEAPADLVLVHHDRAIDTRNQTGLNGIFVKDETTDITPEAATALILVGICIVFLVFICFILFVQKIRRQKLERKVEQSGGEPVKPQTTYEATSSTLHPHPLSLLPPALLHALALATANRENDPAFASFFTMEPPSKNSNSVGRLWFCVNYDYVQSNLVLRVLHARYTKGRGSSTNPGEVWVEACVLTPMNNIKASSKTGTRRASSAPVFNQTFRFEVEDDEVTQYLLRLTMYDRHPQNGEKAVGAVIVPLNAVDLCSDATLSRDLQ
uniref:C2 domain-containing protein n=1 Tax=Scylla olivacea TaxID=85551 RepID=A0A0P4VSM0_SCYOL